MLQPENAVEGSITGMAGLQFDWFGFSGFSMYKSFSCLVNCNPVKREASRCTQILAPYVQWVSLLQPFVCILKREQCDQIGKLRFNLWPFATMTICPVA